MKFDNKMGFGITMAIALFFLADGAIGFATGGGTTTTPSCTAGICTTVTTNGSVITTEVTSATTVYVTTSSGTVVTTTQTWNPSAVQITITPTPILPTVGQSMTFTASTSPPLSGVTYSWFFGDGTSSNGNPVSHTYSGVATFPVTVYVDAIGPQGPYALGSKTIDVHVQCPTFGCIGTQAVLVVDAMSSYTGAAIQGASVSISNPTTGATVASGTTDAGGAYAFTPSTLGTYQVTVSASDYKTQTQQVSVGSSGATANFDMLFSTGCVGACPQSIVGFLSNGAVGLSLELEMGAVLFAVSALGLFLTRDESDGA